MSGILQNLGINWKLFLAQLFNFAVLLVLLYRFLYKPLLTLMEKRSLRIREGLQKAEQAEKDLESARALKEQELTQARREAGRIIAEAEKAAEQLRSERREEAEEEAREIVQRAEQAASREKEEIVKSATEELAQLLVQASSTIMGKEGDRAISRDTAEHALRTLRNTG